MRTGYRVLKQPMRTVEVLDDATSAYALAAQNCFESFHSAANRMAGLLVLFAIVKSRHVLDIEVQQAAARLVETGSEEFRLLTPTMRSSHFHRHLGKAGALLRVAMNDIERTLSGSASAGDPLKPLMSAWGELKSASKCLPGFEVVDFEHACCALHERIVN